MKKIITVLKYIFFGILLTLGTIFLSVIIQSVINPDKIPSIFGYKPFIVLSGSMENEINKGDLVIVKNTDKESLKINDIIAFRDERNYVVTHRIVEINDKNEFITKGDNNNKNDSGSVKFDMIEGKYVTKYKNLGNLFLTMKKPTTLLIVLLIIVFVGVIWIISGNSKLSNDERKELEELRKEKQEKNKKGINRK